MRYSTQNKPPLNTRVIVHPDSDPNLRFAGVVYTVESHQKVNVTLRPVGGGRGLRIAPSSLTDAPADGAPMPQSKAAELPPVTVATVFTVDDGALPKEEPGTLLVVIGFNGLAYKAAVLGGSQGNRYYNQISRAVMHPIPAEKVIPQLKAMLAVFV